MSIVSEGGGWSSSSRKNEIPRNVVVRRNLRNIKDKKISSRNGNTCM